MLLEKAKRLLQQKQQVVVVISGPHNGKEAKESLLATQYRLVLNSVANQTLEKLATQPGPEEKTSKNANVATLEEPKTVDKKEAEGLVHVYELRRNGILFKMLARK